MYDRRRRESLSHLLLARCRRGQTGLSRRRCPLGQPFDHRSPGRPVLAAEDTLAWLQQWHQRDGGWSLPNYASCVWREVN